MNSILNHDVGSSIMDYLHGEYIFLGSINRRCRDYFRTVNNTTTNVSSCFESVLRMTESGILGEKDISMDRYVYNTRSTEVLEYAEKHKIVYSINGALEYAIRRMDIKIIDWMESRCEMHGPACMIAAVESGSLEMVRKYCVDNLLDYRAHNFFPEGSHICNLRERDRLEVCRKWRSYVGDYLIEAVKHHGYFDILKWLHEQKIPDPGECKGVVGEAVNTGSDEMVKWMMNNGYVMLANEMSPLEGIRHGDYTRWLREMCTY